jgi:hypothetical protein
LFSLADADGWRAKNAKGKKRNDSEELDHRERRLLERFYAHWRKDHSIYVHWGMDRPNFSFGHIQSRHRQLLPRGNSSFPSHFCPLSLMDAVGELSKPGQPRIKLNDLIRANGLDQNHRDFREGVKELELLQLRKYREIGSSTQTKTKILFELSTLAHNRKLLPHFESSSWGELKQIAKSGVEIYKTAKNYWDKWKSLIPGST